jgi:hypothetical protein
MCTVELVAYNALQPWTMRGLMRACEADTQLTTVRVACVLVPFFCRNAAPQRHVQQLLQPRQQRHQHQTICCI